jgi:hypothetical protein
MRPRHLGLAALLVALFGAGFLAGKSPATSDSSYRELDTFVEVLDKVQRNYVDPVQPDNLIKGAISGMMHRLDPFSQYLDKNEYADLRSMTEGQFGGLGIVISIRDNYPTVISPVEGTPAYSLGIQSGDVITRIDGTSTRGYSAEDAVRKLRGPEGRRSRSRSRAWARTSASSRSRARSFTSRACPMRSWPRRAWATCGCRTSRRRPAKRCARRSRSSRRLERSRSCSTCATIRAASCRRPWT